MVWQYLSCRLVVLVSSTAAQVLVALGEAIQLALMFWFLALCWRKRTAPEPFWNPPTINVAFSAAAGIAVGLPTSFSVACFALALLLQVTLVPPQVWRTTYDSTVSPSPAVAIMQAPCALNALVWGVMRRDGAAAALLLGTAEPDVLDRLSHALFLVASSVLWLTLLALWRRRRAICSDGFAPSFAALTFPSCSSAVAALQYAGDPAADAAAPRGLPVALRGALFVYAVALALLSLALVLLVLIFFVRHVIQRRPPAPAQPPPPTPPPPTPPTPPTLPPPKTKVELTVVSPSSTTDQLLSC